MKSKVRLISFHLENTNKRGNWPNVIYKGMGAFYNQQGNMMITPYHSLNGWIFDTDRPELLNIATLTGSVHHEITHGFDNHGRLFNYEGLCYHFATSSYLFPYQGQRTDWWDSDTIMKYEEKQQCIAKHYDGYTFEVTFH